LIKVAIAIILDARQRVLITQRAPHLSKGGCWEFPGGKLEQHEPPEIALIREIQEEVGINVLTYRYFDKVVYAYETFGVVLYAYIVRQYRGEARCCEMQTGLRWVEIADLAQYEFPEANRALLDKLGAFSPIV
jgi:8-oxo-dGTP diphosphatase